MPRAVPPPTGSPPAAPDPFRKIRVGTGRRAWRPSPLIGQVVFVTTRNEEGRPNIATKSSPAVVALEEPIVGFGCCSGHRTAVNIRATREFVVNVPGMDLAQLAWDLVEHRDPVGRDMRRFGLTPIPSLEVAPPRVLEARAHIECRLESEKRYGDDVWFFGQVVAASMDHDLLAAGPDRHYDLLQPIVFLESLRYAPIGAVRSAEGERPEEDPQ